MRSRTWLRVTAVAIAAGAWAWAAHPRAAAAESDPLEPAGATSPSSAGRELARGEPAAEPRTLRIPYEHPERVVRAFAGGPSPRIIYLDGCWGDGCEIEVREDDAGHPIEDAREDLSSILDDDAWLPEFPYGEDRFDEIASCVRRIFGPYEVEVTTENPGDEPHWRHIVAGAPSDAGFGPNILGVSPYDFETCQPIPNAISFGFPAASGDDPRELCELAAHELGHSLGLDHVLECRDPMTYKEPCGEKSFQDADARCGESQPRSCHCGERQNSHELLMSQFGERDPEGTSVRVLSPSDGAEVSPGYEIELAVEADHPDRVEISMNSAHREVFSDFGGEAAREPVIAAPEGASDGIHAYAIAAYDEYGRRAETQFEVTQGAPCARSGDCAGDEACVDGRCVPGPSAEGGLGAACAADEDCASGHCAIDSEQDFDDSPAGQCVERCEEGASAGCPAGFQCRDAPGAGGAEAHSVCYSESGGCAASPPGRSGAAPPTVWAVAVMLWLLWRARPERARAFAPRRARR